VSAVGHRREVYRRDYPGHGNLGRRGRSQAETWEREEKFTPPPGLLESQSSVWAGRGKGAGAAAHPPASL